MDEASFESAGGAWFRPILRDAMKHRQLKARQEDRRLELRPMTARPKENYRPQSLDSIRRGQRRDDRPNLFNETAQDRQRNPLTFIRDNDNTNDLFDPKPEK